jgi:uncharacterized membrane protein YdbT with pleckstrin-like domain
MHRLIIPPTVFAILIVGKYVFPDFRFITITVAIVLIAIGIGLEVENNG